MSVLRHIYYFFLDTLQTLILALAIFLIIYVLLVRPFQVSGHSMDPTFQDGQFVLTNLVGYQDIFGWKIRSGTPSRGDVVVFVAPTNKERDYIKRVIGLPGERIMLKEGDVYINGKKFDESGYLKPEVRTLGEGFLQEGQEITVPANQYFVMGDNRLFSSDSREFGPIKRDTIVGHSLFIYWPPTDMKIVKNPFRKN